MRSARSSPSPAATRAFDSRSRRRRRRALVEVGGSVAINGVCLTAETVEGAALTFHAVPETLSRSTARRARRGSAVNLEPALRAGDPMGGHIVQGHVDGVGRVQSVEAEGEGLRVIVEASADMLRYCVEKGSITVEGVSLTVAELHDDAFGVALIPHTIAETTLVRLVPGQRRQSRGRRAREVRRAPARAAPARARRAELAPGYDAPVSTEAPNTVFATVEEAIEEIRAGRFVVVVDDEDRENEGDLTIAAQFVTPEAVNFMATHARGLICLCLTPSAARSSACAR